LHEPLVNWRIGAAIDRGLNVRIRFWLFAVLLPAWFNLAGAAEPVSSFQCGKSRVQLFNSAKKETPFFVLTISGSSGEVYYPYLVEREFFEIRCENGAKSKVFILFNHFCGGSGCAETNYGIVDSDSGKILLAPGDRFVGNADKAAKILGAPVRRFSCEAFSKSSDAKPQNGEYCYLSPIELG
jgi:hypothetical protein